MTREPLTTTRKLVIALLIAGLCLLIMLMVLIDELARGEVLRDICFSEPVAPTDYVPPHSLNRLNETISKGAL